MNSPVFEAVITLSPPNAEDRLSFTLNLYPDDTIQANGHAKPLRECTLEELSAFADSLEADVDALLGQTIGQLVEDPEIKVLINDDDDDDWLDRIVFFEHNDAVTIIEKPDEAVKAEITVEENSQPEPAMEQEILLPDEADEAVVEEIAVVEEPAEPEPVAEFEEIPVEEIPVEEAVAVEESEPIHEEREAAEPATTEQVIAKTPNRTLGVVSERWLNNTVDILVDEDPLRRMEAHASTSLRREVAGVMLGPIPEKQPNNRYIVHVQDIVIAKHTKMRGASVTYTPESWRYMNDVIMERYPNEEMVMVGWYHTHPGFGIFLSGMDIFIHSNFFTQKWHIAYVLDPVALKSGFFSWDLDQQSVKPFPFIWPDWAAGTW